MIIGQGCSLLICNKVKTNMIIKTEEDSKDKIKLENYERVI